jgi:putative transposase
MVGGVIAPALARPMLKKEGRRCSM